MAKAVILFLIRTHELKLVASQPDGKRLKPGIKEQVTSKKHLDTFLIPLPLHSKNSMTVSVKEQVTSKKVGR